MWNIKWDRNTILMAAGAGAGLLLSLFLGARLLRRKSRVPTVTVDSVPALPAGGSAAADGAAGTELQLESQLAERDALQQKLDAKALNALKLSPVITKTAEVMAKHLREKIKQDPEMSAQVLRTWIREEEDVRA